MRWRGQICYRWATVVVDDGWSSSLEKLVDRWGLLPRWFMNEDKARWSVKLPEGEKVLIKGGNLWEADGLKAKISMAGHILYGESLGTMSLVIMRRCGIDDKQG